MDPRRAALTEGTGLAALTQLVPPPPRPYLGDGTWEQLFAEVGSRLPTEYVTLLTSYGAGSWGEHITFRPPLNIAKFVEDIKRFLGSYEGRPGAYPVWPQPGGFLPFAWSADADEIGWLTEGDPEDWPVLVAPRHARQGPPLRHNLTDTLLEWLRDRYSPEGFTGLDEGDDPLDFAVFEPHFA